jgi:hypothetical protein
MDPYIKKLLTRRKKQAAVELTWELHDALREKRDRGAKLTASEQSVLHYCIVSTGDGEGIEYALRESPASIGITAKFAAGRGLKDTVLTDAAQGKPCSEPVSFAAGVPGAMKPLDVPMGKWGATDVVLSLLDEDLDEAIMDFVGEHAEDFALDAPAAVAQPDERHELVSKLAMAKPAVVLMGELLGHRNPRIRALLREDERRGKPTDWVELTLQHRSNGAAKPKVIEQLRKQHGQVANELLDLYREHNGCDLFIVQGNPGFMFAPIEDWPAHLEHVMDWARKVTWNDAPDEIPDYLETAIPFGWIDGDSERWLLVTQGPHAGRVMLSDTDVIDDEPRFLSIGQLVASLTVDTRSVLGCGGYNSYDKRGKPGGPYYPEAYVHD